MHMLNNKVASLPSSENGMRFDGRDAAMVVALAAEGKAPEPILASATQQIGIARDAITRTSTQEDAWLILAAQALSK